MVEPRCVNCARRVPWLSFWGNLTATIYKIVVGVLGGSSALIADGIHSFTDVIGTSAILISRRISDRPADEDHPFGHGKAEFMGSVFIYVVLLFLSVGIFIGGVFVIISGNIAEPRIVTILAAAISVFYNVLMFRLGSCAGSKNNSPALMANAFENRTDAISSVACVLGIGAAVLIDPICDPLAAMAVGVVIFANSIVQLRESMQGLMDRALPPDAVERIRQVVLAQESVCGIGFLKSRQTGSHYWVDLGIQVPGNLSVPQSDAVAATVRGELMSRSARFHSVEVFVSAAPDIAQEPPTEPTASGDEASTRSD